MDREDYLDEVQIRILRVTEDLRAIQRELNFAALEAPQTLKSALDLMRHFLWFYMQVITNESDTGEKIRETLREKNSEEMMIRAEASFLEKFKIAGNTIFLRHLADGK